MIDKGVEVKQRLHTECHCQCTVSSREAKAKFFLLEFFQKMI